MPDTAIVCLKCGAPLEVDGAAGRRRCPFCGVQYDAADALVDGADLERAEAYARAKDLGSKTMFGGSIFVSAFGVLWTVAALSMGAPVPFALFGLAFSAFAIYIGVMARRSWRAGEGGRRARGDFGDSERRSDRR